MQFNSPQEAVEFIDLVIERYRISNGDLKPIKW